MRKAGKLILPLGLYCPGYNWEKFLEWQQAHLRFAATQPGRLSNSLYVRVGDNVAYPQALGIGNYEEEFLQDMEAVLAATLPADPRGSERSAIGLVEAWGGPRYMEISGTMPRQPSHLDTPDKRGGKLIHLLGTDCSQHWEEYVQWQLTSRLPLVRRCPGIYSAQVYERVPLGEDKPRQRVYPRMLAIEEHEDESIIDKITCGAPGYETLRQVDATNLPKLGVVTRWSVYYREMMTARHA